MKSKTLLILISLLLALAASAAALFWLRAQSGSDAKPVEQVTVWTAAEDIPAGTRITEKMLAKTTVPKTQVPADIYMDEKEIIGRYTKNAVLKGESFPPQRLYDSGDNLLSMRLKPGFRAFSIAVTEFSGVADLIKPGDKVDVFVFLKEIAGAEEVIRADVAQVLMQNVEVLAVRRETQSDTPRPEDVANLYAVTLAVPVKAVEKLILAEETGLVKLALRPIEDEGTVTSYGVVWQELLLDSSLQMRRFDLEYGTVEDLNTLTKTKPDQTAGGKSDSAPEAVPQEQSAPKAEEPKPAPAQSIGSPGGGQAYSWYTVQPGDTLMSISRKHFNGSSSYFDDIMRMNGLKDASIRPGQRLKIPTAGR